MYHYIPEQSKTTGKIKCYLLTNHMTQVVFLIFVYHFIFTHFSLIITLPSPIISLTSAAASTTPLWDLPSPPPLLLLLDVPCPDLKSLTLKRVSQHSQERPCKYTIDFHSQVNPLSRTCLQMHRWLLLASQLTLKNVLANAPLTFTHKSPRCWLHPIRKGSPLWHGCLVVVQSSCSFEFDTATRYHTFCCTERSLWTGFCFLRGAVAAQLLPIGATRPVGQDALTGWDQFFPILFVAQVLCSIEQVLSIGCHLY